MRRTILSTLVGFTLLVSCSKFNLYVAPEAGVDAVRPPGLGGTSGSGGPSVTPGSGGAATGNGSIDAPYGSGGSGATTGGSIDAPSGSGGSAGGMGGAEGAACGPGTHVCSGKCLPDTSPASCGSSCAACPSVLGGTATCDGKQCQVQCPVGKKPCDAECIAAGQACSGTCQANFHACGGVCVDSTQVANCGTSCTSCPQPPTGGAATCDGVKCDFKCDTGKRCGERCGECCTNEDCAPQTGRTVTCDTAALKCQTACPAGTKDCNGQCIDSVACCKDADCPMMAARVGKCDTSTRKCEYLCAADTQPCAGRCISATGCCDDNGCNGNFACLNNTCSNGACRAGFALCGTTCIAAGGCCDDTACSGNFACSGHVCSRTTCRGGFKSCNSGCIPTAACCTDGDCTSAPAGHVGKCDTSAHTCSYPCASGTTLCGDGRCISPGPGSCCSDGDCRDATAGHVPKCDPSFNRCTYPCPSGTAECDGICTSQANLSRNCTPVPNCGPGTQRCANGTWGACIGPRSPTPEVCNGVDDNCDGNVDEGNLCPIAGQTCQRMGSGAACVCNSLFGQPCGNNSCLTGTFDCSGRNCVTTPLPDGRPCGDGPRCDSTNTARIGQNTCQNGVCTAPSAVPCGQCKSCSIGTCNNVGDGVGCGPDLACKGGTCLPSCGGADQPCCHGIDCNTGFVCAQTICQPCGQMGEKCCNGNMCASGSACLDASGSGPILDNTAINNPNAICQVCGGAGGFCCGGYFCPSPLRCGESGGFFCVTECGTLASETCCATAGTGALFCDSPLKCDNTPNPLRSPFCHQ
jgi:Notch 1